MEKELMEQEMTYLLESLGIETDIVLFSNKEIYIELMGSKSLTIPWPDAEARNVLMNDKKGLALFMLAGLVVALVAALDET